MLITKLKSKISYAKVTQTDLYYTGSITIDENLMLRAVIKENERVQVANLNNGARFETYVIKGEAGSGVIGINGPAAHLAEVDDELFILSWALIDPSEEDIEPVLVNLSR